MTSAPTGCVTSAPATYFLEQTIQGLDFFHLSNGDQLPDAIVRVKWSDRKKQLTLLGADTDA